MSDEGPVPSPESLPKKDGRDEDNTGAWLVGAAVFVFVFFVIPSSITQGAIIEAFWRALGYPITDSLEITERRAPGRYLPNRCDKWMNERATAAFERMGEKIVCEEPHVSFVCRVLIVSSDDKGPATCFRIDTKKGHGGILYYRKLDCEPNVYSRVESKIATETLVSKTCLLSTEELKEFDTMLAGAKEYYLRYRYRSDRYCSGSEHYLLEFQILGRYFYYDVPGSRPQHAVAPPEPMPPFLQKLMAFLDSMAELKQRAD
jgi:hypothetical protein